MSPRSRLGSAVRAIALAELAGVLLAACGASFDPSVPCSQHGEEGQQSGAYPELEAVVPKDYAGQPPSRVDSGRTCSPDGLGTLAGHGITELRFAGSTWSTGSESGVTLATFSSVNGPDLEAAWLAEFYDASARSGKNVQSLDAYDSDIDGATGRRIDVLNNESYQSVVVWEQDARVVVAVVADSIREVQTKEAHDRNVELAISALRGFGSIPPAVPVPASS